MISYEYSDKHSSIKPIMDIKIVERNVGTWWKAVAGYLISLELPAHFEDMSRLDWRLQPAPRASSQSLA